MDNRDNLDREISPDAGIESEYTEEVLNNGCSEIEEVALLKEELQKKEEESKKHYELYLRTLAELDNIRKRAARERDEYVKFATLPLIQQILKVMDDLERALNAPDPDRDYNILYKGIEMINSRMHEIIGAEGVQPVEAMGKEFDPQYHQPLLVEENNEYPENTIIEELQKGYIMHGRVIRPSLVKVSKAQE